jgi:hypothetical protein
MISNKAEDVLCMAQQCRSQGKVLMAALLRVVYTFFNVMWLVVITIKILKIKYNLYYETVFLRVTSLFLLS